MAIILLKWGVSTLVTNGRIAITMKISREIISLIDEIKKDRTHGASGLARQAAGVLKAAAERSHADSTEQFVCEMRQIAEKLISAKPAMAPIYNIVSRLMSNIAKKAGAMDLARARQYTISKVDEAVKDSLEAVAQIAEHGSELITAGDTVMTHSYSSTVVAALKKAFVKHGNIEVITTRSGAGLSGEITAAELSRHRIPVTFIDDTAIGLYLPRINKCFVGADRICADGKLVNSIGSYLLAIAAEKSGTPFYVLCETLKFDPRISSSEADLEEKAPDEVIKPGRLPPEVRVKNPYFDITPLSLVTGIVTEKGLLGPEEVMGYMGKSKPIPPAGQTRTERGPASA